MTRDGNEALKQPAITSDIEKASFKRVFQRLDAFLEGLLPLLKRGDIALTAARKKALRFVLDETKSGPIDNIYRWDNGNFKQHLSEPQSNWRPRLLIQIAAWSRSPAFVPKLVSEPESTALINVAEILLDLVRGQTSPQEQRDARDKLLREAQNYLWHRGRVDQQGHHCDETKSKSSGLSLDEYNDLAIQEGIKDCQFKEKPNVRRWAEKLGCSTGLVGQLPFYILCAERAGTRKKGKPPKPEVVSLEVVAEDGHPDEELERLIGEQRRDDEPSPLDADAPGRPRKVRAGKKL